MTNKSRTIINQKNIVFDLIFSRFIWILIFGFWILFNNTAFSQTNVLSSEVQSKITATAEAKDLSIDAQTLNYSDDGKYIEAIGSVEVIYKDLNATGERFTYYTADKKINTETGFKLLYQGLNFSGNKLDFNLNTRIGTANQVKVLYQNVTLVGELVKISPDKIELKNSEFTTCDLLHPHYHFQAENIILYPKDGWLICYWARFWIDGVATTPVPVYIYDLKAEEKGAAHLMPYPVFGSNDLDGSYVSQSLPWHVSRNLNGNIAINYAAKKLFGSEFDLNYISDEQNNGNLTLIGNAKDPISLVLGHHYLFGNEIKNRGSFALKLFNMNTFKQFELSSKLALNERINYERVSQFPLLTLTLKKWEYNNLDLSGSIALGYITEESSGASLSSSNAKLNLSVPLLEFQAGTLKPLLDNDFTLYGNGTHWLKTVGGLELDKTWSPQLTTAVGFRTFILNKGISPFNYEMYRFTSSNQINAGFLAGYDGTKYGINVLYNVPSLSPQEFDYLVRIGIHCFNITFAYRVMRNEFNFNFGIN